MVNKTKFREASRISCWCLNRNYKQINKFSSGEVEEPVEDDQQAVEHDQQAAEHDAFACFEKGKYIFNDSSSSSIHLMYKKRD